MEKKTLFVSMVLVGGLLIGVISAQPSWEDHFREMSELHEQYTGGEISYREFVDGMNEEMQETDMPCRMDY